MNTAPKIYKPEESFGENPDYIIPDRIPLLVHDGSGSNKSLLQNSLSTGDERELGEIPKVTSPPDSVPLKGKFKLHQLWEGRIVEVRDSEFDAIITNKTNPDFSEELVTIDIIEVTPDDLPSIRPGSVFYWSIGHLDYPGRGRVRESKIRFRRLKGWTKKELEYAKRVGKEFAEFFKSNSVYPPPSR